MGNGTVVWGGEMMDDGRLAMAQRWRVMGNGMMGDGGT